MCKGKHIKRNKSTLKKQMSILLYHLIILYTIYEKETIATAPFQPHRHESQ